MSYRLYNMITLGALAPAMLLVLVLSFYNQPIDGDLTRIGGYSEREFGWNSRQPALEPEYLFRIAHSLEEWQEPYDLVILGDSFTLRPHTSWASFLAAATGWSVIMFHHNEVGPEELLESEAFLRFPPKLFVYQSVERSVVERLAVVDTPAIEYASHQTSDTRLADSQPIHLAGPLDWNLEVAHAGRRTRYASFQERVSENVHFLETRLRKALLDEPGRVVRLPLEPSGCRAFTAENANTVLVYRDDLTVRDRWQASWSAALEGYERLAAAVEANAVTRFVAMIFPDKLSVYGHLIAEDRLNHSSVIPHLARGRELPRLDLVYRDALEQCTADLYLPNNTHTGGTGSLLAAQALLDFLHRVTPQMAGH